MHCFKTQGKVIETNDCLQNNKKPLDIILFYWKNVFNH